jgi:microcystin-dependent protein
MAQNYSSNAITTSITGGITNSGNALNITDSTGWPSANFVATLERGTVREEQVFIAARSAGSCTGVTRGFGGTTAVAHGQGAVIEHSADAISMQRWEDHLTDPIAAHPASAIALTPTGGVAAATVQAAIAELDTEKATVVALNADITNLTNHLADAIDAHDASAISYVPTGTIAATDVQAAVAEVANEAATNLSAGLASMFQVPTGTILDFAGSAAGMPTGYLPCDGTTRSRTTFAALFAVIGTTWNTGGEAGTDFRLPNISGRSTMGAGTGVGLTARTLGQLVGEENHIQVISELAAHTHIQNAHSHTQPAHMHTINDPGHSHWIAGNSGPTGALGGFYTGSGTGQGSAAAPTGITINAGGLVPDPATAVNQSTGSGMGMNTIHPVAVVTKMIKT